MAKVGLQGKYVGILSHRFFFYTQGGPWALCGVGPLRESGKLLSSLPQAREEATVRTAGLGPFLADRLDSRLVVDLGLSLGLATKPCKAR